MGSLMNDGLKWVNKESEFRKMSVRPLGSEAKTKPVTVNSRNSGFGSDMDLGSNSDDDINNGHYSVESSPEDDNGFTGDKKSVRFAQHYPCRPDTINRKDVVNNIHCDASAMLSSGGHSHSTFKKSVDMDEERSKTLSTRVPNYHASGLSPWNGVVSYDACVRLCLSSWGKGCKEASFFLNNECATLRDAFSLRHVLLQSEEEVMSGRSSELISGAAAAKPQKTIGKIKVQVRKVKMASDTPSGCVFPQMSKFDLERLQGQVSNVKSKLVLKWEALQRIQAARHIPKHGSLSSKSLAYVHVGTQYMKEIGVLLKSSLTSSETTTSQVVQETYFCLVRLKSSSDEDAVRMQPGSGETHIFFPSSLVDDLNLVVLDSKGNHCGCVVAQVASVMDANHDKVRWWTIYKEPDHEPIGKVQLYLSYSTSQDDNSHLKCGVVAETVAYDLVLETAMKAQNFKQRNLLLHSQWKWLVTEFASFYGVSDAYTKLRYLSYVMDVATPTADCLLLIHDLLSPVIPKGNTLSHQEKRILGESSERVEELLALVFENYKSLDETSPSGLTAVSKSATGVVAPAIAPAIKLYGLQHDMLSPESKLKLCKYFQVAAKKRSRRHLGEIDDSSFCSEGATMDSETSTSLYQKMKSLSLTLKNEIYTDIEINNQDILPSFLDLPNLTSSIYSAELSTRLRTFLKACRPTGPSPPVTELVVTVADFERDLDLWNINSVKGGVNAKELFGSYISNWIKEKHVSLLDFCRASMVKSSDVKGQQLTCPSIDEINDQLMQTLNEYEIIVRRWPEYAVVLESVMADVQNAVIETLEKQHTDVLSPLKDNLTNLGLKYVQKFAKRTDGFYTAPAELGVVLNSMRKMLDVLLPKIEAQMKAWSGCIDDAGIAVPGERLTEVTIRLRAKFRNYIQAVLEKLLENINEDLSNGEDGSRSLPWENLILALLTRLQSSTKWKKIIYDFKETTAESDVQSRMQPLQELVIKTMVHLHSILENSVFLTVCRGFWDKLGQEVLNCLENNKENRSWYKGLRIALDVSFTSSLMIAKFVRNELLYTYFCQNNLIKVFWQI
ncbi:Ankyrin repeat domain-containing protein 50 [Bienertia sinuspersici]